VSEVAAAERVASRPVIGVKLVESLHESSGQVVKVSCGTPFKRMAITGALASMQNERCMQTTVPGMADVQVPWLRHRMAELTCRAVIKTASPFGLILSGT
jgi:hypothetical protein